jgi:hypothetical protein
MLGVFFLLEGLFFLVSLPNEERRKIFLENEVV